MAFFTAFLVTFSSLLTAEGTLARLLAGLVCLLFGVWVRFFGGKPSPWLAPLFLVSCFLRLVPLWGGFTDILGDPRGGILFFLTLLTVFLLAADKKEAPPSRLTERTAIPFSLLAMVLCGLLLRDGILWEGYVIQENALPALACSLSGMLLLPRSKSLPLTYGGILAGIFLALFPRGLGQGLLLAILSPLLGAAELRMVCSLWAYTLNTRKKPRKE